MIEAKNDYVITKKLEATKAEVTASFNVGVTPKKDEVIAVGPGVENVKVGDIVILNYNEAINFEHDGQLYTSAAERNVIAKVGGNE